MSTTPGASAPKPGKPTKKEVKMLMVHGYTQSGPLFHAKTRALEKLLTKTLAPLNLQPTLIYPTGPFRLRASDLPGFDPASLASEEDSDHWAWFRKDEATATYRGLEAGMATLADVIRAAGGVDACCGFSQGGAVAAIVAAAMEDGREVPGEDHWARGLREANGGRPLKFAVSWAGFYGPVEELRWCYEPKIKTPTLHFCGSLDTVVDETRTGALIEKCTEPVVVSHPGGHHVPVSREYAMALAGFVKQYASDEAAPKAEL